MNKTEYAIIGYLQWHRGLSEDPYAGNYIDDLLEAINKVRNLSKKHHRLCEDYCNGKFKNIDEFERKQNAVQDKIRQLCHSLFNVGYGFQNDPRGATVRLFINCKDMTNLLYL